MFLKAKSVGGDFTTFITFGTDFTVSSIDDLVTKVRGACEDRTLQELVFYSHGAAGSFSIGSDQLGGIERPKDSQAKTSQLGRLWPSFCMGNPTGRARLVLCICEAGKNTENLKAIADAIRVPVFACTGDVRPTLGIGYGYWSGGIVMADPFSADVKTISAIPAPPVIFA